MFRVDCINRFSTEYELFFPFFSRFRLEDKEQPGIQPQVQPFANRLFGWWEEFNPGGSNPFLGCLVGEWQGMELTRKGIFARDAGWLHPPKSGGRSRPPFLGVSRHHVLSSTRPRAQQGAPELGPQRGAPART